MPIKWKRKRRIEKGGRRKLKGEKVRVKVVRRNGKVRMII